MGLLAMALLASGRPALAADAKCVITPAGRLPVIMQDRRPIVLGSLAGLDVPFIIDSGAAYSLISPAAVERIGAKPRGSGRVAGVSGRVEVQAVSLPNVRLGQLQAPRMDFLVGAPTLFGDQVGGLIGQNVLGHSDIEYDLSGGVIRLIQATGCKGAALAYWSDAPEVLKLEPMSRRFPHIQGVVSVDGVRLRAVFDTGAPRSIMTLKGAARAGITPQSAGVAPAGRSGGMDGRTIDSWSAPVGVVEIGGETIRDTRLTIADFALPYADMLIGADFFLSHRLVVSPDQGRMYFTYKGGEPFEVREPEAPVPDPPAPEQPTR